MNEPLQPCRQDGQLREFQRFTVRDLEAGRTAGWTLAAGWFRTSEITWAWFRREVSDGEA